MIERALNFDFKLYINVKYLKYSIKKSKYINLYKIINCSFINNIYLSDKNID